jgi:hypothetical protein
MCGLFEADSKRGRTLDSLSQQKGRPLNDRVISSYADLD